MRRPVLICLLTFACSGPTELRTPAGTWTLVAIDGVALPATIHADTRAVSGMLSLNSDGTYSEYTTFTYGPSAQGAQQYTVNGSWRESSGVVELLNRLAGLPYAGKWRGSELEIRGQFLMKYTR